MKLGKIIFSKAKHLSVLTLLGASLMSFNSYADSCSLSAPVDSEGVYPIAWNNGDYLGSTQASNQTHACSSAPAGSSITSITASYRYEGKGDVVNNRLPYGDYKLNLFANGSSATGLFNIDGSGGAILGHSGSFTTHAFNGMDPRNLTFSASGKIDPDGTNFRCRDINNPSFCYQWMKMHYSFTINYDAPVVLPPAVGWVNANLVSDDVTISWGSSTDATYYNREVSINGGGWQNTKTYYHPQTSVLFPDQKPRTYQYRVRSCNDDGCSDWTTSNTITVKVLKPTGFSASASGRTVTLTWNTVAHATHFEREVTVNGGGWINNRTLYGTSTVYTNYNFGTYQYRLRACAATGCSDWTYSNTIAVVEPVPDAPASVSASVNGRTVTLNWSAVLYADKFEREVTVNGGNWKNRYDLYGTSKTYVNYNPGTYQYRMRACNEQGCSTSWTYSNTIVVQ